MLPVPIDRTSGRRSSSIGCRSIVGRRASVYISSSSSCDPLKVSNYFFSSYVHSYIPTLRNELPNLNLWLNQMLYNCIKMYAADRIRGGLIISICLMGQKIILQSQIDR